MNKVWTKRLQGTFWLCRSVQIAIKKRITPERDHLRSRVDNTVRPTVTEQLLAALSERLTVKHGLLLIFVAVRTL